MVWERSGWRRGEKRLWWRQSQHVCVVLIRSRKWIGREKREVHFQLKERHTRRLGSRTKESGCG